jgi:hypothetical protein
VVHKHNAALTAPGPDGKVQGKIRTHEQPEPVAEPDLKRAGQQLEGDSENNAHIELQATPRRVSSAVMRKEYDNKE